MHLFTLFNTAWYTASQIPLRRRILGSTHTAKTKHRNFETNIPRKGISGSQSQFPHSCVCERFTYIFPRSVSLFCWRKYVDRSWDYVNHSQTRECWNWGWGRAIPRKGIHKMDFLCSAGVLRLWHWQSETLTTWRDPIPLTTNHRSNPVPFHVPFPLYRVMICALSKFCSNKVAYICTYGTVNM